MKVQPRDVGVDCLKGFLILCVLFGHLNLFLWSENPKSATIAAGLKINETVYFFHMVLFLAVGLFYVRPFSGGTVRTDLLRILFPFLFWVVRPDLLYDPWGLGFPSRFTTRLPNAFYGNITHGSGILWYLPALFWGKTIHSFYIRLKKHGHIIGARSLVFVSLAITAVLYWHLEYVTDLDRSGEVPMSLNTIIYLYPLFWLLCWVYEKRDFVARKISWFASLAVAALSVATMWMFEPMRWAHRVDIARFRVPFTLAGNVAMIALCVSLLTFFLAVRFKRRGLPRFLAIVGEYSFPIFLLHEGGLVYFDRILVMKTHVTGLRVFFSVLGIPLTALFLIVFSNLMMALCPKLSYIGFHRSDEVMKWLRRLGGYVSKVLPRTF